MQLVVPRAVSAAEMAATIIRRITSHVDLLSFIVVCFVLFLNVNLPDSELCSPELLLHSRKCVKKLPVNFIVNYYLFAGVFVGLRRREGLLPKMPPQ